MMNIKSKVVGTIKNAKSKAAAATALAICTIGNANAALTYDPTAAIGTAQTTMEGYIDLIMNWFWVVAPVLMLGWAAWKLLNKGVNRSVS